MKTHVIPVFLALLTPALQGTRAQQTHIDWNSVLLVSRSTPTLQVVVNPMLYPGSPIHDASFAAVKSLGADYVRYVPWLPYPKAAVAELEPPSAGVTHWDFTSIDPVTRDFFAATAGHSTIINFSTIPAWMFKTAKPVTYPSDPNQVFWDYTQGTELRDPTGAVLGDYYARLVSWYTQGGFTDEAGQRHSSGYHYSIPTWEVLNEVESEHSTTPEDYTLRYDAIVSAIRRVSPQTRFMGLALAAPSDNPRFFEYFLNPAHHKPGIPLDYISFHFYATPAADESPDTWQHTFFDQADGFLATTRYILVIRDRLSPATKIDTDELGVILPNDNRESASQLAMPSRIPPRYWNAAAALYAYLFIELSQLGVDVIGESQLVGYPSQFPSVTMIDWTDAKPNARFWALKLIKDNFHPGDKLVGEPSDLFDRPEIAIQGFITPEGRKVLFVNKTNAEKIVKLQPDLANGATWTVDEATGDNPPRAGTANGTELKLAPFAVTVLQAPSTQAQLESVKSFVKGYIGADAATDKTIQISLAFVDLRGDGAREAIVYLSGRLFCGSGGCTTLILAPDGPSWKLVSKIPISRLPIRVLPTTSHGWRDISVTVQGGDTVQLSFDGSTYPENPTIPPAKLYNGSPGLDAITETSESSPLNP